MIPTDEWWVWLPWTHRWMLLVGDDEYEVPASMIAALYVRDNAIVRLGTREEAATW